MGMEGRSLGQVATLSLVTILIGFVGKGDKFTFRRSPAEFPNFSVVAPLFVAEFTVFSLKPIFKTAMYKKVQKKSFPHLTQNRSFRLCRECVRAQDSLEEKHYQGLDQKEQSG